MTTPLLEIEDLCARVCDKEIIKGFNLTINEGEVHAIMGPNGAGKSTLSYVLCGKPGYEVTSGSVRFRGKDLLAMSTEERAREGIFLCMQYPVEIPGVPTTTFLKHAVNAIRQYHNLPELDTMEFVKMVREEGKKLGIDNEMIKRPVNVGFPAVRKTSRNSANVNFEAGAFRLGRSGFGIGHRCAESGCRRRKCPAGRSSLHVGHYALSAPFELCRAGLCPCLCRRAYRQVR